MSRERNYSLNTLRRTMPVGISSARSVYKRRQIRLEAVGDASHKAAWIQKMLRAEVTLGPPAAGFEFDSQEVSNVTKDTIFHNAQQLAVGVAHAQRRALGHGPLDRF